MSTLLLLIGLLPSLLCELPATPIELSKETTFIIEPLAGDGLPNYALAIQEFAHKEITPEQNGAVPFWQALGQCDMSDEEFKQLSLEIGLTPDTGVKPLVPLEDKSTIQAIAEWLRETGRSSDDAELTKLAEEYIAWVQYNPWTATYVPPLAKWLTDNELALDLVVEASERTHFYSPYPNLLVDRSTPVLEMKLSHVEQMLTVRRALMARAMFDLGNKDIERAWNHFKAFMRLGNHHAQGPTLVEQLLAMAMRDLGMKGTWIILSQPDLRPELGQKILSDIERLRQVIDISISLDFSERFLSLDYALRLLTGRLGGMPDEVRINEYALIFDITLQHINERYNLIAKAARIEDRRERTEQLKLIDQMFSEETKNQKSFVLPGLFSKAVRSRHMGQIFFEICCPEFQAAFSGVDRDEQYFELTSIAAALAVYKAEHGHYPDKLAELSPSLLLEIPLDLYTEKPLHYRRMKEGYLLYSVFENGIDDGGTDLNVEWQAAKQEVDRDKCDLVIRIPVVPQPKP